MVCKFVFYDYKNMIASVHHNVDAEKDERGLFKPGTFYEEVKKVAEKKDLDKSEWWNCKIFDVDGNKIDQYFNIGYRGL